ncbi:glycosyltransferase [Nocardia mikamii]|uniref:glycosyltransferase n=1 Tax=Nocardia mikamii TaxID=508464 RepID=UPI000A02BD64|nr:nucleotide disphospho-sugar-binding domain-containing protein [Nocardia mikamii]
MEGTSRVARYLVAATPIPGHVAPMLAVAADLRRRGHQVRMLSGAAFATAAQSSDVVFVPLPADAEVVRVPESSAGMPGLVRRWRTGRAEMRSGFLAPLAGQYRALTAELARSRADVVLVDVMFTGAIPLLLGERRRPPVVVCGVVPLMLSSADSAPFGIGWQPAAGRDYTMMNRVVHTVLFRRDQSAFDTVLRELGVGPCPVYPLDWPILAERLLQFTVPEFEYPRRDLPPSVVFTGPVAGSPSEAALPGWWDEALSDGRKVVLVTQGTWNNSDLGQLIQPTLSALAGRTDVVVVACTGGAPTRIRPTAANTYVADFLPYARLLPHVAVMITNGGYGGVQQALSHGVPLIVAGDAADKPEVAARVAYTGAGIDLGTGHPSSAALAEAVDRILSTPRFRSAASRLARAMARTTAFETIDEQLATVAGHRPPSRPPLPSADVSADRRTS